jgi:Spy/CpxP family protein refolding chaperone
MKTKPTLLGIALLLSGSTLAAQQPQTSAPAPAPEQRPNTPPERRPNVGNPTGPREGRGNLPPGPGARPGMNQPPRPDGFMESFFPPELIMHHQRAINLTDDQRKRLIETIQKSQPQFTDWQWQLEAEQGILSALMRAEKPDEKQILAQLDKVLKLESDMKRGQLLMLVRLKNELTTEQQAKLRELTPRPRMSGAGPNAAPPHARPPGDRPPGDRPASR